MKNDFSKIKNSLNSQLFLQQLAGFFERSFGWILFVIFLAFVLCGCFLWYSLVINSRWSDFRRQEYVKTKEKGAVLNVNRLNDVVLEKNSRAERYEEEISGLEDIFRLKTE